MTTYHAISAVLNTVDYLNIDNIKEILKLQKEYLLSIDVTNFYNATEAELADHIEHYLLSDQDITDMHRFFADDVDYGYVAELRSDLLHDVLDYHNLTVLA